MLKFELDKIHSFVKSQRIHLCKLEFEGNVEFVLGATHITDIEVDGGVKMENVKRVVDAGANWLVSGSGLFKGDLKANIQEMKNIIYMEVYLYYLQFNAALCLFDPDVRCHRFFEFSVIFIYLN